MKKKHVLILLLSLLLLLTACGADSAKDTNQAEDDQGSNSFGNEEMSEEESGVNEVTPASERMIIHRAYLTIQVNNLTETQANIEKRVEQYGGYIVEATVYQGHNDQVSGQMTLRIPEKHFQDFLTETETAAAKVLERNVTGQDITEEFVDLESRLKSKLIVEERLLEFMDEAEKTEDLLQISTELAHVQEEIEVITGKMTYIKNQVAFATVDISIYEENIKIPTLDNKNLDTWAKTKKQLATSVNFIISAGSGLFVFIVGNIPLIILILIPLSLIYVIWHKKRQNKIKKE